MAIATATTRLDRMGSYKVPFAVTTFVENTDVDAHGNTISDGPDTERVVFISNSRIEAEIKLCYLERENPRERFYLSEGHIMGGYELLPPYPPEGWETTDLVQVD